MRALIVCAAPVPGTEALVTRAAREADLLIAADGGGAVCRAAGLVPDVLLGDFDSLSRGDRDALEAAGAKVLRFDAEKDVSDLELALAEARAEGASDVTITAAVSGRVDHTLATFAAAAGAADLRPVIAEPGMTAWVLAAEHRSHLVLEGDRATVTLLPFGAPARVTASGLKWPLADATLQPASTLGLSNRIVPGARARIVVTDGVLLVLSPFEAGVRSARAV